MDIESRVSSLEREIQSIKTELMMASLHAEFGEFRREIRDGLRAQTWRICLLWTILVVAVYLLDKLDHQDLTMGTDTESRTAVLEVDMSSLKTDVAVIRSNYATKEDLLLLEARLISKIESLRTETHRELHAHTWKIYGFGVLLVGAVHMLQKFGY